MVPRICLKHRTWAHHRTWDSQLKTCSSTRRGASHPVRMIPAATSLETASCNFGSSAAGKRAEYHVSGEDMRDSDVCCTHGSSCWNKTTIGLQWQTHEDSRHITTLLLVRVRGDLFISSPWTSGQQFHIFPALGSHPSQTCEDIPESGSPMWSCGTANLRHFIQPSTSPPTMFRYPSQSDIICFCASRGLFCISFKNMLI